MTDKNKQIGRLIEKLNEQLKMKMTDIKVIYDQYGNVIELKYTGWPQK